MKYPLVMMHAISRLWRSEHAFQMYTAILWYLLRVSFWKQQRIVGQWIAKWFFSIRIVVVKTTRIQALNTYKQGQHIALEDLSHSCAININQKSKILKVQMQKEDVAANHTPDNPHSSMSNSVIHKQYWIRKKMLYSTQDHPSSQHSLHMCRYFIGTRNTFSKICGIKHKYIVMTE